MDSLSHEVQIEVTTLNLKITAKAAERDSSCYRVSDAGDPLTPLPPDARCGSRSGRPTAIGLVQCDPVLQLRSSIAWPATATTRLQTTDNVSEPGPARSWIARLSCHALCTGRADMPLCSASIIKRPEGPRRRAPDPENTQSLFVQRERALTSFCL